MSSPTYDTDRIWTLPNVISLARLFGVPLFLWLVLGPREDAWAVVVLIVAGATDFVDGRIARTTHQVSRLGQMLDPVADRIYIAAVIVGLGLRGIVPWWLVAVLLLRDMTMIALVPALRTRGFTSLPVHFLGKIATFMLLYALPIVLLGADTGPWAYLARVVGWASLVWGAFLYWWAGAVYVVQTIQVVREDPRLAKHERPGRR